MASKRRIGAQSSETRSLILDAAEQLMLEEGYGTITSRRLAAKAGLKSQLVHYYFGTMEELLFALMRRGAERMFDMHAKALASDQPLWALWDLCRNQTIARLAVEMLALASHSKEIAAEQARYAEQLRAMQTAALSRPLREYGLAPEVCPAVSASVLMVAVAHALGIEATLGIATGHRETQTLVEQFLTRFEGPRKQPGAVPRKRSAVRVDKSRTGSGARD
jgi:TetR/AcrR family transcriptional regulator